MAREIVDIALIELNGQELQTVRSMTVGKTDKKTVQKTMRRKRRALGYSRGVPDFSVQLEVLYPLAPEVDWDALQKSGQTFLMAYEKGVDGRRRQLIDCTVSDISEPYDEGGEVKVSITIEALDERSED